MSKLHGNFLNKITNDETNINTEIFNERFKYQNSSCLVKDSYNGNTNIYEEVVNNVKYSLIDLWNAVNKKSSWKWKYW